jgi:hydroxymethylpyrimidine pyrophosphatase-like HAD family hydrolase
MGKPFKKELLLLDETYKWAGKVQIDLSPNEVEQLKSLPTFVVGSGGSFSACHMFSLLQQSRGCFSKPVTPLELHYTKDTIRNANVVFLSASGRNSDILFGYNTAIRQGAHNILGICMKQHTKLAALSLNHSISKILEFESPAGKDGFLATNSLIAYFTILSRIFGYKHEIAVLGNYELLHEKLEKFSDKLYPDFTITVLYAGWAQPVAIDIESKFTEAGLGNILTSDFRNFGHGRHNWFDKKKNQSAIVALVTPDEEELAQKTLSLLPEYVPKLILYSNYSSFLSTIDLLIQSFFLAEAVGKKVGIDPGRPGVPFYGSKLYNLRYRYLLDTKDDFKTNNIILKKCGRTNIEELDKSERKFWMDNLNKFKKKINSTKFGCIVLDYDGTLSTNEERKNLLSDEIINALNSFIHRGFVIGIVSGRGKSIREALQACFERKYWKNIIIGYYNGGIIASLDDMSQPDITGKPSQSLRKLAELLNKQNLSNGKPTITLRPLQLTIEKSDMGNWRWIKNFVKETVEIQGLSDILILESGHSIDIICRPQVSKLNILNYCVNICKEKGLAHEIICVGDKGRYPGNDYELLSTEFSLSVDEVSSDPETCWNLSELGQRGKLSCLNYLNSAKFTKSYFTLSV